MLISRKVIWVGADSNYTKTKELQGFQKGPSCGHPPQGKDNRHFLLNPLNGDTALTRNKFNGTPSTLKTPTVIALQWVQQNLPLGHRSFQILIMTNWIKVPLHRSLVITLFIYNTIKGYKIEFWVKNKQ